MQGMSVVVRPKSRNCVAGRARRGFCPRGVQVIFELGGGRNLVSSGPLTNWTGGPPIAAHEAVSSSSSINGRSGSSIDGDSNFVQFCNQLHEGLEFSKGGADVAGKTECWACSLNT